MNFTYDKEKVTDRAELMISVADLRDLVQAFTIPDKVQRLRELHVVLASIVRKNKLPVGSVGVEQ